MNLSLIYDKWPPSQNGAIQLYSMNTPNGIKVSVALEELGLPYDAHLVHIGKDDQFSEAYKQLSPNSKIPTILDPNGPNGEPLALMESGAILIYLAEKTGELMPTDAVGKSQHIQWLLFQVGHLGPMFGQFGHFFKFAKDTCTHPYPLERYTKEAKRLLAVLDERLKDRPYIMGDSFSMVDCASFPWVECLGGFYGAGEHLELAIFKHVQSWLKRCMARPSYQVGKDVCKP